jgi:4-hydroxysphinganine ceramide fatty acyl 2-hydroxylase
MDSTISTIPSNPTVKNLHEGRPSFPIYKREQARISRHRLYPTTIFYTTYLLVIFYFAFRSGHPRIAVLFAVAGIINWSLVEYFFHRYVLHGRFADGKGFIRKFAHRRLDPLHWEHHERPWDATHISGVVKDLLPLFAVAAPLSFIAPVYTLPILLAVTCEGYVFEEWAHHIIHFYNFRNPYFRYIKRHHLYHHSERGEKLGFGITSGFWDIFFNTRYPSEIRSRLRESKRKAVLNPAR